MSSKTVLVTGASGLLGRDVVRAFELDGWRVVGTALTRPQLPTVVSLDLLDVESVTRLLDEVKPDVVVHCAANRFPDSCESDPESAIALNVTATHSLATLTSARSIFLIYISTDYVFPGRKGEAPYKTTDTTDPTNTYGKTKAEGEKAVLDVTGGDGEQRQGRSQGVVLRVPLLYGHCEADDKSGSAVHAVLSAVREVQKRNCNTAVDDWALRFPTATEDVGRVVKDVANLYTSAEAANRGLPQVLHFSGKEQYTKYEMARFFAEEILGQTMENIAAQTPDLSAAGGVNRPYNTQLDTTVLEELGISTADLDFKAWWRRELRAYRH